MNKILQETKLSSGGTLQLVQGDITAARVDAIVNAANAQLEHGGGVAGVISRKGGPRIQQESRAWVEKHGPVSHGSPALTSGGELPCDYVIHAVGPVWGSGDEASKLRQAVTGSLKAADRNQLSSLALPAISTGIFGYPQDQAASVILTAIQEYAEDHPDSSLNAVQLILYDDQAAETFSQVWNGLFA